MCRWDDAVRKRIVCRAGLDPPGTKRRIGSRCVKWDAETGKWHVRRIEHGGANRQPIALAARLSRLMHLTRLNLPETTCVACLSTNSIVPTKSPCARTRPQPEDPKGGAHDAHRFSTRQDAASKNPGQLSDGRFAPALSVFFGYFLCAKESDSREARKHCFYH
jgi:hypothetical protein